MLRSFVWYYCVMIKDGLNPIDAFKIAWELARQDV
jgi:hypothetical protein